MSSNQNDNQVAINNTFLDDNHDTIVALCTPRGSGAIALLRLSGLNAIDIASSIAKLSSGKKLHESPSHTIHHGFVINPNQDNTIVDEVLFFLMKGPRTFTGQDTVEISCHNNPFLIDQIISCCIEHGARSAKPGEFSKRAYLNGKIDLLQAEALNDLLGAQTELALKKSLSQLHGSFSSYIKKLEEELFNLLCHVESSFEFLEEEQRDLQFDELIREKTAAILQEIKQTKDMFNVQQQIKQGIRIALIGSVNVGKSTLFNALAKKDRAIVTQTPGTTRDCIEYSLYKDGNFWLIIDTAGLRQTHDTIEQEGIQRSYQEAASADIILLVIDASTNITEQEQEIYTTIHQQYADKTIVVINKIDCDKPNNLDLFEESNVIKISAKNNVGISDLESSIHQKIQNLFSKLNSPFLLNQRQHKLMCEIETKLQSIEKILSDPIQYELVAYHLKEILENLSELTGKNITEGVLDTVFKTFCVGK